MGGRWDGGVRGGRGGVERLYLIARCHHQNDSRIEMGSDESHINVSLTVRDKVTKTVSTKLLSRQK